MINKNNIVWILAGIIFLGLGFMAFNGKNKPKPKTEPKVKEEVKI